MNEEQKKAYLEKYAQAKAKGEKFWPDAILKDMLMSLAMFVLLILLATFMGVANEPKADPSDSTYIPRPEWYFLFLFKFLALYGQIPVVGKIEWIATAVVPALGVGALFLVPFLDRSPNRHRSKRIFPLTVMAVMVVTIVTLTLIGDVPISYGEGVYIPGILQLISGLALPGLSLVILFLTAFFVKKSTNQIMVWTTALSSLAMVVLTAVILIMSPPPAAAEEEGTIAGTLSEQILAGTDLYSINCVECHGAEGEGGEVKGVEGLEGVVLAPINASDTMYTFTDDTLYNIIAYGQPDQGMTPFARQYGGELGPGDIDAIVAFMRYSWDDRAELPQEVVAASTIPALAEGEVPSYEVHMAPLIKRYCISCHRQGKKNNNYLMGSYDEVMNGGDNAPNVIPGDLSSHIIRMINREDLGDIGGPMPPSKALKPEIIDIFTRWVLGGAPNTAAEAAAAGAAAP
jgi:mono/diheme cytochrome c family protein